MTQHSVPGRDRPLSLLIGALGGEGGGLLADWLVAAATETGILVQSTSIPGVAQRTGATTYYIEMMKPVAGRAGEPVFGLYPAPGHLDLVVTSELVEAGRALENGFVSPERTILIASTHRVLAMEEKTAMGEGAVDAGRIQKAADLLARRAILRDFEALALDSGTALNALLLGAIAATGLCPIERPAFEAAIAARGVAVKANLAGFSAGFALASGDMEAPKRKAEKRQTVAGSGPADTLLVRARRDFPQETLVIVGEGVRRLIDYQDAAYGETYLDRLDTVLAADRDAKGAAHGFALTRETARHLALWMAYEDVIRVADLKSRMGRHARVRREVAAKAHEPVRMTEFLKPGIDELASVLPVRAGRALVCWAERRGIKGRLHIAMHVRSDTVSGVLRLRLIAALKPFRRRGYRFAAEQALIELWLETIRHGARIDHALAREIAECGRLVKGYSDTRARAFANFDRIFAALIAPALSGLIAPDEAARQIAGARQAALADEEGKVLDAFLSQLAPQTADEVPVAAGGITASPQAVAG